MSNGYDLILEKLDALERRMSGLETRIAGDMLSLNRQMTTLLDSFKQHGERLTQLEHKCLENHVGTQPPELYVPDET